MSSHILINRYQDDVASGAILFSEIQLRALTAMIPSFDGLCQKQRWFQRTLDIKGLYLWGPVGRGKTYLMDLFFETIPIQDKMRWHFHRFMRHVHESLLAHHGHADPLQRIASHIAEETRLLCLDEFMVDDIGDAMILGGLLRALFDASVVVVTTSNVQPEQLYKNGLQRSQFIPAIHAMLEYLSVIHVDHEFDYRLRLLQQSAVYAVLAQEAHHDHLAKLFLQLTHHESRISTLEVEGRVLDVLGVSGDLAWFAFQILCGSGRSVMDYIHLCSCYHTMFLSGVFQMSAQHDDVAKRFMHLVDECYDRHVRLVIASDTPIELLYTGERLSTTFERTKSRLIEMQSDVYLSQR